jgi:hypothetical protein
VDIADDRRIDSEDPRQRAHLRELGHSGRHQQVRRELVRRKRHLVQHNDSAAGPGERRRQRAPRQTTADHHDICSFHRVRHLPISLVDG